MINIIKFCKENSFEILIGICISIILIYGLYRTITNKKGNWNTTYSLTNGDKKINLNTNNKKPPKESKGELECKRCLEKIFNKPFNKVRPNFLNNTVTGGDFNLEIDCYNDELKLGVEYQGVQHYKYIPFFHKNKEAFYNQKYRDELKRRMCKDNGITLIEVPHTIKIENIENFLLKELSKY